MKRAELILKSIVASVIFVFWVGGASAVEFVGADKLDEVFSNFDRKGSQGWKHLEGWPDKIKVKGGFISSSGPGASPSEGAEKAFDGNAKTKYCRLSVDMWVQFSAQKGTRKVAAYAITSANDAPERDPRDWSLEASSDGNKWVLLDKKSDQVFGSRFDRREFALRESVEYAHYRLRASSNGANITQIAELELLAKPGPRAASAARATSGDRALRTHPDTQNWESLFGDDLSQAEFPEGVWTTENGELTASEDQVIWSKGEYENFVLDLEFKNGENANSGVLLYVTDKGRWVQNSVEVQITDDFGKKWINSDPKRKCAAIFGCLAAEKSVVKPAGEWNRYTLTCDGPFIDVVLNGAHVTSMDMRKWDSPTHNPDGSKKPPWLSTPFAGHPTRGHIGLQGKHGGSPIWFRNIKIMPIEALAEAKPSS